MRVGKPRLRICIAGRAPFWGGAEVAALRLARGLSDRGHEVIMLVGQDAEPRKQYDAAGLRTAIFPLAYTGWSTMWSYAVRRRAIRQFLAAEGIDLLHVNDLPTAQICVDAARSAGIPAVVHHRFIYDGPAIQWFNKHPPDRHLYISVSLQQQLRERCATLAAQPGSVVYDGVEILPEQHARDEARAACGFADDEIVVMFAGQLAPVKGVTQLVEAWDRLPEQTHMRGRLVILGDDLQRDGAHRRELQNQARSMKNPPRFVGFQRDLRPWWQACDVAVVPSLAEPLGLVALEAMRAGRPVVASAVGGLCETVQDGRTGLLVPPNDPASLAEALERLMNDAALRETWGAAGRTRCVEHFSLNRHVEGVLECYAQVLSFAERAAA